MTNSIEFGSYLGSLSSKQAQHPQLGVQSYLPLDSKYDFTDDEKKLLAKGESRWLPRIFQSYGTPAHELMSSPGKGALLYGLGGGGLGALLGKVIGEKYNFDTPNNVAAIGGGLGALGGAGLGYFSRKANNEGIKDLLSRYPYDISKHMVTKRDLLADPAYQRDIDRSYDRASQASNVGLLASILSRR